MRHKHPFETHSKLRDEKIQGQTENFAICDGNFFKNKTNEVTKDGDTVSLRVQDINKVMPSYMTTNTKSFQIYNFWCGKNNDKWKLIGEVESFNNPVYINRYTQDASTVSPKDYKDQLLEDIASKIRLSTHFSHVLS